MANALFDAFREDCLDSSGGNLTSDNIVLVFVDHADDTPAPTTDVAADLDQTGIWKLALEVTVGAITSKSTQTEFEVGL